MTGGASGSRPLPLAGITVLDLGHIYQGPYAGLLLALAGARVVKVEPPGGEGLRGRSGSLPFAMLNGNKESVSIDLKQRQGVEVFHRLAASVDVVIMNFAPGVPERLGIGADDLLATNPRLVVAHGAGFGVRGPDGRPLGDATPAMDLTIQAHAGPMGITGHEGQPPLKSGAAFVDFLGGTHLYGAVTTALFERERTGRGRSVEVSMADATYFTLTTALGNWYLQGRTTRAGNRHPAGTLAPYGVYPCRDGHLALIAVNNRHWQSVLAVIGRGDLADDERFRRLTRRAEHEAEVDRLVEDWTSVRPRAEAVAAFQAAHVPAAAVRYVDEIVHDPAAAERSSIQWIDHPDCGHIPVPNSPIRWHGSPLLDLEASPALGADTRAVLSGLAGFDLDEVAALTEAGVIVGPAG